MKIKPYFSYWSGGYAKWNNKLVEPLTFQSFDIAVKLALKHYGEAHFVTDSLCAEVFKEIPFTSVEVILDDLPKEYTKTWALGKIYAYQHIALKGDPFVHIDNDVFLWKPLPVDLICAPIFAQSPEPINSYSYKIHDFYKNCPKKYLASKVKKNNFAPNVGVVGGKDLGFFYNYSRSAISLILDPKNKSYWTKDFGLVTWRKAVISEQYYMGICASFYKKNITYLFPKNDSYSEKCYQLGYTHLMGSKYGYGMKEKVNFLYNKKFSN